MVLLVSLTSGTRLQSQHKHGHEGPRVHNAGCTLTVAVITDWLLTVGSVGDSKAVLDTGSQFMEVSPEHRVEHHRAEQDRLRAAGTYLAPISIYMDGAAEPDEPGYGPLRAWPGGLCVSR